MARAIRTATRAVRNPCSSGCPMDRSVASDSAATTSASRSGRGKAVIRTKSDIAAAFVRAPRADRRRPEPVFRGDLAKGADAAQVPLASSTRVPGRQAGPSRRPPLTRLADALDRFLLPLVVLAAAVGIAWPAPGRHLDAGNGILVTLAVLVFCTGASMTFRHIGAVKAASERLL